VRSFACHMSHLFSENRSHAGGVVNGLVALPVVAAVQRAVEVGDGPGLGGARLFGLKLFGLQLMLLLLLSM
jgi:hypothetical protein